MPQRSTILTGFLASFCCAFAWGADPALINFAPPDSGVVIGINLDQIKASDLGQTIVSKLDNADLKKFVATIGFDPLRDLHEILIAAPAGNRKSHGLFLLRGIFDPARFVEAAGKQPGVTASNYKGWVIMTTKGQGSEPMSLVCVNSSLLMGGDMESVRAALSRNGPGTGPNPGLAAKAAEMSLGYDIWLVSRVSPADFTGDAPQTNVGGSVQMELLRSIEQASGGVKFGTNILIAADLTTHTPKDAEGIVSVLRLFIGLAASNQHNAKQAAAILEKLSLNADGNSVKLSFSMPEAELAQAVQSSMGGMMAQMKSGAAQGSAPAGVVRPNSAGVVRPKPQPTGVTIYSSPRDMGTVTLPPQSQ
jgi:hypothetical protein